MDAEFPRDVAASAEEAAKSGQKDAYAAKMCKLLGDPEVRAGPETCLRQRRKVLASKRTGGCVVRNMFAAASTAQPGALRCVPCTSP